MSERGPMGLGNGDGLTEELGREREPSPTYWPGSRDREKVGPIGDGTPHARMEWFWARMKGQTELITELTGYNPVGPSYGFEAAIADAFDKLAAEREEHAAKLLNAVVQVMQMDMLRRCHEDRAELKQQLRAAEVRMSELIRYVGE